MKFECIRSRERGKVVEEAGPEVKPADIFPPLRPSISYPSPLWVEW